MTLEEFQERVRSGRYKKAGFASRALHKTNLSQREKKKGQHTIEHHFGDDEEQEKPKKKKQKPTPKRPRPPMKQPKDTPSFEVLFARVANGKKDDVLSFLRGAVGRGYTLPELIKSLEAV